MPSFITASFKGRVDDNEKECLIYIGYSFFSFITNSYVSAFGENIGNYCLPCAKLTAA